MMQHGTVNIVCPWGHSLCRDFKCVEDDCNCLCDFCVTERAKQTQTPPCPSNHDDSTHRCLSYRKTCKCGCEICKRTHIGPFAKTSKAINIPFVNWPETAEDADTIVAALSIALGLAIPPIEKTKEAFDAFFFNLPMDDPSVHLKPNVNKKGITLFNVQAKHNDVIVAHCLPIIFGQTPPSAPIFIELPHAQERYAMVMESKFRRFLVNPSRHSPSPWTLNRTGTVLTLTYPGKCDRRQISCLIDLATSFICLQPIVTWNDTSHPTSATDTISTLINERFNALESLIANLSKGQNAPAQPPKTQVAVTTTRKRSQRMPASPLSLLQKQELLSEVAASTQVAGNKQLADKLVIIESLNGTCVVEYDDDVDASAVFDVLVSFECKLASTAIKVTRMVTTAPPVGKTMSSQLVKLIQDIYRPENKPTLWFRSGQGRITEASGRVEIRYDDTHVSLALIKGDVDEFDSLCSSAMASFFLSCPENVAHSRQAQVKVASGDSTPSISQLCERLARLLQNTAYKPTPVLYYGQPGFSVTRRHNIVLLTGYRNQERIDDHTRLVRFSNHVIPWHDWDKFIDAMNLLIDTNVTFKVIDPPRSPQQPCNTLA